MFKDRCIVFYAARGDAFCTLPLSMLPPEIILRIARLSVCNDPLQREHESGELTSNDFFNIESIPRICSLETVSLPI